MKTLFSSAGNKIIIITTFNYMATRDIDMFTIKLPWTYLV